jgi:hypothetical protein
MTATITQTAQQLAEEAADAYFVALAGDLPSDNAPGDFSLLDQGLAIQDLIAESARHSHQRHGDASECPHCSMVAGFVLGVAVGKRMGGAR